MHHNIPHIKRDHDKKNRKIHVYLIKLNNVWSSESLSSGSVGDIGDSSNQRHECQITIHKMHIQCVHLHWCMHDNDASMKPRKCWTMLVKSHSRSWLMLDPFLPTLAVGLAIFVNVVPFHHWRSLLVRDHDRQKRQAIAVHCHFIVTESQSRHVQHLVEHSHPKTWWHTGISEFEGKE